MPIIDNNAIKRLAKGKLLPHRSAWSPSGLFAESDGGSRKSWPSPSISVGSRHHERGTARFC